MVRKPFLIHYGLVVTFIAACLANALPAESLAQGTLTSGGTANSWPFRTDLFQLLLEEQGLVPQDTLGRALAAPKRSAIIIISDTNRPLPVASEALVGFAERGGALLIARELSQADPISTTSVAGLGTFVKGPVQATDASHQYETFDDCIRVTAISDRGARFNGLSTIITNRSGWFLPSTAGRFQWETVASFPGQTSPQASQNKALLAIGHSALSSDGMVIVCADASLLTNGMLWHGDNAILSIRLSELLRGEEKDRFVFIGNDQVLGSATKRLADQLRDEQARALPNVESPEPTLERLLRISNAVVKEIADSNIMNETLRQQPRNLSPRRYFRLLVICFITALLAWAIWKLLTSRTMRTMWMARRQMKSAYQMQAGQAGDYRQASGYLAREFCWELTGSRQSSDWQKFLARLTNSESAFNASELRELTRIFDIASRGSQERMSSYDLQRLGQTIAALRAGRHELGLKAPAAKAATRTS